jgi:hypothetical protein
MNILRTPVPGIAAGATRWRSVMAASLRALMPPGCAGVCVGLARGTQDSLLQAVYATRGSDGQRHVLAAQAVYGAGTTQVFLCDGRSVTVGAQSDVITDVQNELDGYGSEPGGWMCGGTTVGVAAAAILTVDVDVEVALGPTPNLAQAQQAIRNALYGLLFGWPIGQSLSYAQVTRRIDDTVVEMLGVTYTLPAAFATSPTSDILVAYGVKMMPGALSVTVRRATGHDHR